MNPSGPTAHTTIETASVDPAQAVDVWFESDERRRQRMQLLLEWPRTHSSLVGHVEIGPGDLDMPHYHSAEEIVYVIEGTMEMTVANESVQAKAGDVIAIPAGTLHSPKNVGEGPLRILVFLTSAVASHTFEDTVLPMSAPTFVTPLA
jgi:quercetin dioxygenase-like cupin family protein